MQISEDEVVSKRTVGTLHGNKVVEVALKGGLYLIFSTIKNKITALGSGAHRAIAKFTACKKEPDLIWNALNKADHVEYEHFRHLVPLYETVTEQINQALQRRQR